MPDRARSVTRHALAGVLLVVVAVLPARAQQPLPNPPDHVEFLPRYDLELAAAGLGSGDSDRFLWDARWRGDFDLVDYMFGRLSFLSEYRAVLGDEFQPFDPNQSVYLLEASASGRVGRTELAAVFHHVSRHLSDRAKLQNVAMNVVEGRVLRQFAVRSTVIDFVATVGHLTQRAYVDYTWVGELDATARRPLKPHLGVYGRAFGQVYGVDQQNHPVLPRRETQYGGRLEAGLRISGKRGAMEIFGGYERVIDADPLDRQARQWPFAGFRLVN